MSQYIDSMLDYIQEILNCHHIANNQHYQSPKGIGKIGLVGYLIGFLNGSAFTFLICCFIFNIRSSVYAALITWNLYVFFLTLFHFMEFFITSLYQPSTLSYDSWIVNHSKSYTIAALSSWTEFWLEYLIFGRSKFYFRSGIFIGLLFVLMGQSIRSLAMYQCGENFSHQIADEKKSSHQLVTEGVYRVLRHPSYFGWFYWSVGTQLILCNPLCVIMYTIVSWKFFSQRIAYEEYLLRQFFKERYEQYQRSTIIGIPFI